MSDFSPGQTAGRLVTIGEAARQSGQLREHVDRAIKRGLIPFERVDGQRVVELANVFKYVERRAAEKLRELSGAVQ